MQFKVFTAGSVYTKEEAEKLKTLGFVFTHPKGDECLGIKEDTSTYYINNDGVTVDFQSLEDLVKFTNSWGEIVLKGDYIEIYDADRE